MTAYNDVLQIARSATAERILLSSQEPALYGPVRLTLATWSSVRAVTARLQQEGYDVYNVEGEEIEVTLRFDAPPRGNRQLLEEWLDA